MSFAVSLGALVSKVAPLAVLLAVALLVGCEQQDRIATYTVPKPESIETPIKRPQAGAMPPAMPNRPAPTAAAPKVEFDTPEGWQKSAGNAFSVAALEVVDGDERIETTVSPAGGDLVANMNRWRDQVKLPDYTAEELEKAFEPIEVNGKEAMYIEMHSPAEAPKQESILGVVVADGDRTWFVKLRGSTSLANREKANFKSFAKSLRW